MPVVTSARVGSRVGTGVPARMKLRIPSVIVTRPKRISTAPMVQLNFESMPVGRSGSGKNASSAKPTIKKPRKISGGGAMTPGVSLAVMRSSLARNRRIDEALLSRREDGVDAIEAVAGLFNRAKKQPAAILNDT